MKRVFSAIVTCSVLVGLSLLLAGCNSDSAARSTMQSSEPEDSELDVFRRIGGTNTLIASLSVERRGSRDSGSSYGASYVTHNYLFFDLETKSSRWLLSANKQLVLWCREIRVGDALEDCGQVGSKSGTDEPAPVALFFLTANQDTNGNDLLDSDDQKQLALAGFSGQNFEIVLDGIDEYQGVHWLGETSMVVIAERFGELQAIELDVINRKVNEVTVLPKRPSDLKDAV